MKNIFLIVLFLPLSSLAQELFPHTEPASTLPKTVVGLRYSLETFNNSGRLSLWNGLKLMYGASSRLTFIGSTSVSNHHTRRFPAPVSANYFYHHSPVNFTNGRSDTDNPFLWEGIALYGKYRFLTRDGEHSHWRMAAYGEISKSFVAHREADPVLNGSTSGAGAGLIITKLHKKLALSTTAGYIYPFQYRERDSLLFFRPGQAFMLNFSIGYLAYPARYKTYKDLNVNLYIEFMNKIYGKAEYVHHDIKINEKYYPLLRGSHYSEVRPAVQFIINSNTRIDASVSLLIHQFIGIRRYPVYMINLQRYFFK